MDCEDSSYNSTSEAELDSDPEDPERLLNAWLGELDSLTVVSRWTGSRCRLHRKWKRDTSWLFTRYISNCHFLHVHLRRVSCDVDDCRCPLRNINTVYFEETLSKIVLLLSEVRCRNCSLRLPENSSDEYCTNSFVNCWTVRLLKRLGCGIIPRNLGVNSPCEFRDGPSNNECIFLEGFLFFSFPLLITTPSLEHAPLHLFEVCDSPPAGSKLWQPQSLNWRFTSRRQVRKLP